MKREGRQHGTVRSYMILPPPWNSRSKSKIVNQFDSPPTAGLYTKVSAKPTNHSKFTGKCDRPMCSGCHTRPACKSRDKAKGTHKLRSSDLAVNHRLLTWRVVDKGVGLNCRGVSATGFLGHLSGSYYDQEEEEEDDDDGDRETEDVVDERVEDRTDDTVAESSGVKDEPLMGDGPMEIDGGDDMGFYDVGFVWDLGDDNEDWCLVGEM